MTRRRTHPATPAAASPAPLRSLPGPGVLALAAVLILLWVLGYADSLRLPFVRDDYFFLDKVRGAGFAELWAPRDLISGYYRPWGRELHFWALERAFGLQVVPWHLTSAALWLAVLALYFVFVRRLAGTVTAAIATAGATALGAWGVLLVWVSGAQDLWMLLFGLLCLLACSSRHPVWAATALAGALLSKELALVLPFIALSYQVLCERASWPQALRRTAAFWPMLAAWAIAHPALGGRFAYGSGIRFDPRGRPAAGLADLSRLLAMANLDRRLEPAAGWGPALLLGAVTAAALAGLVLWSAAAQPRGPATSATFVPRVETRRLLWFGGVWSLAGWSAAFMPSLGWHPYYGLLGALGAWLVVAVALTRRPMVAATLVGAVGLLRPAHQSTRSEDWGTESYQRRVAAAVGYLHGELVARHPVLPAHSRIYLANLPGETGLVTGTGEAPAFRLWYRDTTLRGGFFREYTPRRAGSPGDDFFFAADSNLRLIEFHRGAHAVPADLARNPVWQLGENELATIFSERGEWDAALQGFLTLASVDPGAYDYAHNAAVCYARLGDTLSAVRWLRRSAALSDSARRAVTTRR